MLLSDIGQRSIYIVFGRPASFHNLLRVVDRRIQNHLYHKGVVDMILVDTHGDCFVQLSSLNPLGYRGQYVRTSDGRLFQEREIDVAYQALSLRPFNGHDEDDEPDYVATVNLDGYENAIWDT